MTSTGTELEPSFSQFGEKCSGILIAKDVSRYEAAWKCAHRHDGPIEAESCAREELARRNLGRARVSSQQGHLP